MAAASCSVRPLTSGTVTSLPVKTVRMANTKLRSKPATITAAMRAKTHGESHMPVVVTAATVRATSAMTAVAPRRLSTLEMGWAVRQTV